MGAWRDESRGCGDAGNDDARNEQRSSHEAWRYRCFNAMEPNDNDGERESDGGAEPC